MDASPSPPPTVIDAGPSFVPPTSVVAIGTWVPIRRAPRRDGELLGYLRAGGITAVDGMPAGRDTCPVHRDHPEGGWYHVTAGGYICVGGALAVPWPARGVRRPVQPALDAGMPYQYAIVYGSVNLYRAPPTRDELRVYEPWRFHHDDASAAGESGDASANVASTAPPEHADAAATTTSTHHDHAITAANSASESTDDTTSSTPDGEPTLRELRGDRRGPVIRRMLRGMYLALDRTLLSHSTGESYWHTQSGGYVRTGPLSIVHNVSTFAGVVIDGTHTLPFAWMVSNTGWNYRLSASDRDASSHHHLPRLTPVPLTPDPPVEIAGQTYYRAADGFAVNARNVRIAVLRPPPAGVAQDERWIDVDLDAQVLVAYRGTAPEFATLVSTGRRNEDDPERNHETPAGSFRIRGKHITTTMDGDTAADGPYSIEDVPWVEYFYESYALHGAFWHGNYGWRMSHGCVNLSPSDARWLFFWTEPALPPGWHGVFSSADHLGTRVELHHGDHPAPRVPTR
jgi:hypothetical protein